MTGSEGLSPSDGLNTTQAEATLWAARRSLGALSARDAADLEAWLAEPGRAACLADAEAWLAGLDAAASHSAFAHMRVEARAAGTPHRRARVWAAAAAAAAVLGLGWSAQRADSGRRDQAPALAATQSLVFETGVGERRELRLADGSYVKLNTGSRLEVAYAPRVRALRLVRGQAMFRVAHDRAWPFVVTAGDRRVTAVGTAFDVRLDGPRVTVVLTEGRVKVEPVRRGLLEGAMRRPGPASLSAGEALESDGRGGAGVVKVDVALATSWHDGRLVFRDEALAAAAAEFNRYSTHPLIVGDAGVGALKVSGVFDVSGRAEFVAAVTNLYPVTARPDASGAVVLTWRRPG